MAASRETPQDREDRESALAASATHPEPAPAETKPAKAPRPTRRGTPKSAAADPPIVLDADPAPTFGRRPAAGERRSLVGSAARIKIDDRKAIQALRYRRQAWQSEAWDYADEVPEIGHTLDFTANLLSKLRLYSAVRPDPTGPPVPVDDPEAKVDATDAKIAMDVLSRLSSVEGGQSVLLGDLAYNLEVAGECYLHGHEDPDTGEEDWNVRSVDELVVTGDSFALRAGPGVNVYQQIPADDVVIRLWQKHRRFGQLATCAMRRVLSAAENLLLLDRELRATAQSRLPNGLLLVSQDMSFGPPDPTRDLGDGDARDDPFLSDLDEAFRTAIQEPGAASAAQPIVVQVPYDQVEHGANLVKLGRDMDATLESRQEAQVMRVARGLAMPVEVSTGLQETTFANAAQVKRSEWESYGEPKATLMVDALTSGYYQWMLVEAGMDRVQARQHFIWYDPSACIAAPDPITFADKDHEDGLISDEARRRLHGHSEADAPTDDEIARRMLFRATRIDPTVMAQLFKITGIAPDIQIPMPPNGFIGDNVDQPEQPAKIVAAATLALPAGASRGRRLGRQLASIDMDLRTRLRTEANASMRRALEKAGNRLRSKASDQHDSAIRNLAATVPSADLAAVMGPGMVAAVGFAADDLLRGAFHDLAATFNAWTSRAYRQAMQAYQAEGGRIDADQEQALTVAADSRTADAAEWLLGAVAALAARRLYDPTPGVEPQGEVADGVPAGLIRQAMALAGGWSPTEGANGSVLAASGGPVGGVAVSADIVGLLADNGGGVEGYVWVYGPAPRQTPFEPHELMDGISFSSWDDDVLTNDDGWPDDLLYPGDHDGCLCDAEPVLFMPEGDIAAEVGPSGQLPEGDDQ